MSGHNQIESVVALTDVVAISVRRDQYTELIQKNTPVALKIIRTFANKMRLLNDTLTRLTLKNTVAPSPEHLYSVASYYEKAGMIDPAIYAYYQYLKACPHGVNVENAKRRFIVLKPRSHAVYFEPPKEPIRLYPKNTMVFCEDQSGQDMFIIQEGQIKISKVVDGNEVILAVLKKGEFFGEMALLENMPRSASAIAFEDCRLMTVNRQNFNQMVTTQAQLIAKLTTTLAERLWSMSRQLANTQIPDPFHKLFDMLALQLEKARIQCAAGVSYNFDLSPTDLANMCGIPQEQQAACLHHFMTDSRIRLENNKITVPDTLEIVKSAAFYRKQVH
jgi:CRP-like cAMP-binding protein